MGDEIGGNLDDGPVKKDSRGTCYARSQHSVFAGRGLASADRSSSVDQKKVGIISYEIVDRRIIFTLIAPDATGPLWSNA